MTEISNGRTAGPPNSAAVWDLHLELRCSLWEADRILRGSSIAESLAAKWRRVQPEKENHIVKTMGDLIEHHGLVPDPAVFETIAADLEIPVHSAIQFQGDLAFIPITPGAFSAKWQEVPKRGVELLTGMGGHTHRLVADPGVCHWTTDARSEQGIGMIDAGESVYVQHEEHGALGLAPGWWEVRRQVEWADQQRQLVAD